ncbi:MAG: transketolase [Erysipelotrichaceae bacterium]|nr:transketolase [Erysipelotrichaceae bacterium]
MRRDDLCVAAIRSTCIDAINKSNSGHPGMSIGSAPIIYALYSKHLIADPKHPDWINRDRFVLSAGHASVLLYTMLHVAGYKISMDDLKQFRQINSITPGHPEVDVTPGVDASSGPLGQGIAQAVGLAMAEQSLRNIYKEGYRFIDHYTYCLCGDGCLQEGISQEAISFAGRQKLNKLILLYDCNNVTLDGGLEMSSNENTKKRFESCNWNVIEVKDGNNVKAIDRAIKKAKESNEKPTIIICHTIIGYGSKNQGTSKVHGAPLGAEDGKNTKLSYGYDYPDFTIPNTVYNHMNKTFGARGEKEYSDWEKRFASYRNTYPHEAAKFISTQDNDVSTYVFDKGPYYEPGYKDATRNSSGIILNLVHKSVFNLIGGSADVAGSVKTAIKDGIDFTPEHREGRNVNFGIREFAMGCIQNGMLLHGGVRTYGGCFLVFSDYLKPAIRMASLSKLPAIYLFSHDSLAVGEDGPTHQPVEQLAMLRSIPHNFVYRPCDINETAAAWKLSLKSTNHPSCIILSRQNLPLIEGSRSDDVYKGGYVISKERGAKPDITLIATGSEVSLAVEAQEKLLLDNIDARVVSIPCVELFLQQDAQYINDVLGCEYNHRLAIEMLSPFGWHRFAPHVMGVEEFGKSGPANAVIKEYNFTVEEVIKRVQDII